MNIACRVGMNLFYLKGLINVNIFKVLSKFSIRKQILFGYFPIIILLGFFAFSSQQKFNTFSKNIQQLASNTNENLVLLEIERDMNELERSVLAYSYVGYGGVLKRIAHLQDKIDQKFKIVDGFAARDEKTRDRFTRLTGHYESYKSNFQRVITKQQKIQASLDDGLLPIYTQIMRHLNEVEKIAQTRGNQDILLWTAQLQKEWISIYLNVQSFQITPDSSVIKETTTLITASSETIKKAKVDSAYNDYLPQLTKLEKLSLDYKEPYLELINTKQVYLHLINVVLAGKAAEMDRLLYELDDFAKEQSLQLNETILRNNENAHNHFIILSILACTFGVLLAWLVASGIAKPISRMTYTLSRLAQGRFDTVIPEVDRRDEVGEMAQAADAFKTMAYEIDEQRQDIEITQTKLTTILDNVVDGIITIDPKGTISSYNNACKTIFGYSPEEAIGKNVKFLMPDPYHSEHDNYLKNYKKTSKKKIIGIGREVIGKRKDGSEFPMELSVSEIIVRGQKIFTGVVRDISDRRAAETQVKEALQFQNLVSENIPDMMFVKDAEYKIVQANPTFLEVYPKDKRDQVIGYTTLEEYDDEQAKEFLKYDRQALEEGYSEVEETITFPDGRERTLLTKKTRFENMAGEKFILAVGRDITASKKAEAEILRSNEELGRFAYIASHDLQEPLRMVSNFTGLLNEEYGADMGEQAQQYMQFSLEASKRMQALISDLLEYSQTSQEEGQLSEFDAAEQVQYAIENLHDLIEQSNAKIDIGDMPHIVSHPMRFSRLMQNLIGNGIKYRPDDQAPEIKIASKEREKDWVFSITDNGIGIKEEYQKQIFEMFKRLHHKQEYSGTGIGLAICMRIVESFGGQLWVESEFGSGSTFYFSIPKTQVRKTT